MIDAPDFVLPVPEGSRISGGFGARYTDGQGNPYQHRGTDFAIPTGTPLVAPAAGKVIKIYPESSSFGNAPVIDHGPRFEFRYSVLAHCERVLDILGESVIPGELVALSGNTGLSTGPHTHWQLCIVDWFPRLISYSTDPMPHVTTEDDMRKLEDLTMAIYAHPSELVAVGLGLASREEVLAAAESRVQKTLTGQEWYGSPFWTLDAHVSLPMHGGAAKADHEHGYQPPPVYGHKHEPGGVMQ